MENKKSRSIKTSRYVEFLLLLLYYQKKFWFCQQNMVAVLLEGPDRSTCQT